MRRHFRRVQEAFKFGNMFCSHPKVGASLMSSINRPGGIDRAVDALLREFNLIKPTNAASKETALRILGKDFIPPEQIAEVKGYAYTSRQIEELYRTLPNEETLHWLANNEYFLVAGPPSALSFYQICKREPEYVDTRVYTNTGRGDWYMLRGVTFAREETVCCRWYMLRKKLAGTGCRTQTVHELHKQLSDRETVPTAVELLWGMDIFMSTGRLMNPLFSSFARTASIASNGFVVMLGFMRKDGFGKLRMTVSTDHPTKTWRPLAVMCKNV